VYHGVLNKRPRSGIGKKYQGAIRNNYDNLMRLS